MFLPILGSCFLHVQGPPGPTGRRGEKVGHGLGVKCPRYQGLWQVGYWGLEFLGGSLTHPCPYPFSTGGAWSPWGPRSGE